jgi:simple sugar transport system ATP-binding protein
MGKTGATEKILNIMFGGKPIPECSLVEKKISDQVVLQLEDVEVMNSRDVIGLKKVSFEIHGGEIFGIAGVDGNGQKSLCEAIAGQRELISGHIRFKGDDISRKSVSKRHEMGISYITDDRMNEGCVLDLSLSENAILRRYCQTPYSRFNIINNSVVDGYANRLISDFDVKATGPDVRAGTLSGGNIQKFILARGLSTKPGLIVCSKPTYGLDAKTVSYIQELLLEESKQGTSVLLITSDMDELINCSDRIGVLFNGRIMGVLDKCDATPEKIGKLMLGINE